ncbi:SufD family Fe-S cluster assembly protein [Candidatus Berkelbacteria bacterium]|nr:SufD family Fe-S cluster assembly protein [Candidatus Berkelbacteria bacterium]
MKTIPILFLDNKEVHRDYNFVLDKPGQSLEIVVLAVLGENGWVFSKLNIHHKAPNTTSNTTVRAVLGSNSFLKLDGVIRVDEHCSNVQAELKERALLISDQAKVETIPSMEVLNNDVKVSHGASVSRLSEEQLFYLRSRGLTLQAASKLLTRGFIADAAGALKRPLQLKIEKKLDSIMGYA